MKNSILYISEAEISKVLLSADVIEVVDGVFSSLNDDKVVFAENMLLSSGVKKNNRFIAMSVSLPELGVLGLKWISVYMEPEPGFPFSHGNLIVINDAKTAAPLAILGASGITAMRTAGGHAVVGAKYLSVKKPDVLTFIGCGNQGKSGIRGFLTEFPSIKEIRVYDQYVPGCEDVKEIYGDQVNVTICKSAREAVEGAKIVVVVTSSKEVLVTSDMIEPGMTVIGLHGFVDLDLDLVTKADKWILGYKGEDIPNIIREPEMLHGKRIAEELVWADLPEVIRGAKSGRTNDNEIILFSHMGMAVLDIACANMAYQRALQKGLGTKLEI